MSIRSLLLGLLLGLAAGWMASTLTRGSPAAPQDPAPADSTPAKPEVPEDPVVLTGMPVRSDPTARHEPLDLPTLRRRVAQAKIDADGQALVQTLRELSHLDTRQAHEVLLSVVKDPGVHLTAGLAQDLQTWLADADVEGVAEAAKSRFAIRRKAGYDLLRAGAGWFALIGAHDGMAALAWARTEGWHEHQALWHELVTGFLESSHPEAVTFACELTQRDLSDPRVWQDGLRTPRMIRLAFDTWARLDPAAGVPALERELELTLDPQGGPRPLLPSPLLALYARRLPDDAVNGATKLIRDLADREHYEQEAWGLIHRLERRGLDLGPLADVILRPAVLLEEAAAHGGPADEKEASRIQRARTWILSYPWAWSDRSLEAVERSIEWERWPADQEALRARLLEARTRRRWSGSAQD